jgi:hypothetical protein
LVKNAISFQTWSFKGPNNRGPSAIVINKTFDSMSAFWRLKIGPQKVLRLLSEPSHPKIDQFQILLAENGARLLVLFVSELIDDNYAHHTGRNLA